MFDKFKAIEQEINTLTVNETQLINNYSEVATSTAQEQEA
jgi:hypothetical protein